jgi:hypothetical protein
MYLGIEIFLAATNGTPTQGHQMDVCFYLFGDIDNLDAR